MVLHFTQSVESELKDKPSESPQLVGIKSSSIISSKQIKVQQHACVCLQNTSYTVTVCSKLKLFTRTLSCMLSLQGIPTECGPCQRVQV